jgi:aqualysin 1
MAMKRCLALLVTLLLASCADARDPLVPEAVPHSASHPEAVLAAQLAAIGAEVIPGRYIVTLADEVDPSAVLRAFDLEAHFVYRSALNGFAATISPQALERLRADGRVLRIEPDIRSRLAPPVTRPEGNHSHSLQPAASPAASSGATSSGVQSAPNWGLDRISQRQLPLDGLYRYEHTGRGVNAYIIGSGIRFTHEDFEGRASLGVDVRGDGRNGVDCHGLGTHSASVVGGRTFGVAKEANLIAVRVTWECTVVAEESAVLAGIDWVTANHVKPAVAHLFSDRYGESVANAIRNSIAAGVSYALPAGHTSDVDGMHGQDACQRAIPGIRDGMTVSAANGSDARFLTANWGECVDWYAPDGGGIIAASAASDGATGGPPSAWHMTTTAAAFAAGVAALYLETDPGATPQQVLEQIRAFATRDVITNVGPPGPPVNRHMLHSLFTGEGIPPGPPVPAAPADLTAETMSASRIRLSWQHNGEAVDAFEVQRADAGGEFRTITWLERDVRTWDNSAAIWPLQPGTHYTYRIRATNSTGASGWSNEAGATTQDAPPPPTNLQVTALSSGEIELTWTWDGDDATNFEIERVTHGVVITGPGFNSYVDRRVQPGIEYTYRVRVIAREVASERSNLASATPPTAPAPSPPETIVLAIADTAWVGDDVMVTLRWTQARGQRVELFVDGIWQRATDNTGEDVVYVRRPDGADFTFRICEQHFVNCSNTVTRNLTKPSKPGGGGGRGRPPR